MTQVATIESITAGEELHAAARSTLYRHLAEWARFPWHDFHKSALAGDLAPLAEECISVLPYHVDGAARFIVALDDVERDYDLFQSAYVGAFDVGAGGPPCPLYGGAWVGDRQKVMEEALRFYRFFGLGLSQEERELPDHLATQLEFLHYLTFKEVEARRADADVHSPRRAARDFLVRHPARWLPLAVKKLEPLDVPRFWKGLVGLTEAFCRADAEYLVATEGPVSR